MAKHNKRYAMLINIDRCVGCYACQVSCKAEYSIPFGTFRCKVETYNTGTYPKINKFFMPRLCNHCKNAPCIESCEETALFKNDDGIVLLDNDKCTGCQQCYDKCPYNAIEIRPDTGQAEKCDFCYDSRVVKGLLPVCVQSCMGKAITFGDINDSKSEIASALEHCDIKVLNPELNANPSVFYLYKGDTLNSPLRDHKIAITRSAKSTLIEPDVTRNEDAAKSINSSCAMCPSECGISVTVENGSAKKIYGNPHSLINNGTLCAKGASGLQLTYSPYRIKTPLMRTGKRGEDRWKKITWDEASKHIAVKLIEIKKAHGPESVFLNCGDVTDREAYYRLFHAFGTPNTFDHGSICDPNRKWGHGIMTGDERPLPDIQRPFLLRNNEGETHLYKNHDIKLLLNIGGNPLVATRFNYMSSGIPGAREENKCKYIVIDPSFTNSASHADIWLPIKPGTDAALLASVLYHIISNDSPDNESHGYIDHDFLRNYTAGWQEFKTAFLSYTDKKDPLNGFNFFTPEWAENITGISADNIKNISHLFGITKPAAIEIGMHGTAHHHNGDVTSILMTTLCLITGNMDIPGGLVFIDSQKAKKGNLAKGKKFLEKVISKKVNGSDIQGKRSELHKDLYGDFPAAWKGVLADLPTKIREGVTLKHGPFKNYKYPVRAFISRAGNPVITAGNTHDWTNAVTAMDKNGEYTLDLMVFIDTHITETGKYADIVLPEAGYLERIGLSDVYTMSPEIAIRDQVIKPLHESKTPFEIMTVLANALVSNGDPDIRPEDFEKYINEEAFINDLLSESPGFHNIGSPLPYPDLPEGCLITGTPDNPTAIWGNTMIKKGEPLTVNWLRKNNGVAVWPSSYYRYKKQDGSPSGVYPKTGSKKFEFKFSYLEKINSRFGTNFPSSFYWSESRWVPGNTSFNNAVKEYPFQLISGRVHYSMTMTGICPHLAETSTECMQPLNSEFQHTVPELKNNPEEYGIPAGEIKFKSGTVSIPVLALNKTDGDHLNLKTGDIITLENPSKNRMQGKVFLTEEIMPGVIKTAFGPGGQNASGTGLLNHTSSYTQNINRLFNPKNLSPFTGMPGFGDIIVKIIKQN